MQLSTQSFIADTWVVTGSSFIEWFAGSCVYCSLQVLVFTAHYRSLCYCNAEFWTILVVMHNYTWGKMRWCDWMHPCSRTQPFNCCYRGPSAVSSFIEYNLTYLTINHLVFYMWGFIGVEYLCYITNSLNQLALRGLSEHRVYQPLHLHTTRFTINH